jgi:SAM-dependent methyltransferase
MRSETISGPEDGLQTPWSSYVERYRSRDWRDLIFRDMILEDVRNQGPRPTILDIGCGGGLDGSIPLQCSIAEASGRFIGIEPDPDISLGEYFTESHRCLFEEAPLAAGSVNVAYTVMVLEHIPDPHAFWDRLHEVLADGGVFWGLTVDARHPFSRLSLWSGRLKVKDLYLDRILGRKSDEGRYKNYPTYYRTNTPETIKRHARGFRSCECVNFSRVGQFSSYLPRALRGMADWLDRITIRQGWPGTLLVVRAVK